MTQPPPKKLRLDRMILVLLVLAGIAAAVVLLVLK